MTPPHASSTSFEKSLAIEVIANRLLLRALIATIIAADPAKAPTTAKSFLAAIEVMANSAVMAKDHEAALHTAAVMLVRRRATSFLAEFGLAECVNAPSPQVDLLSTLSNFAESAGSSSAAAGQPAGRRQAVSI